MPKPTDERIAAALAQGARVADVNALIADLQIEIAAANAEAKRLDDLSIAMTTTEAEAEKATADADKVRRRVTRLTAKVTGLHARVKEIEENVRRKAADAARKAAIKTRDALAEELADKWPKLTGEMVDLLERIQASDAECLAADRSGALESAEAIARSCSPNFILPGLHQMIPRLTAIKLYGLDASTSQAITYGIWPKRELGRDL